MRVVGLIPARGGSKGIPKKNLAPLRGKPLVAHTIEVARASRTLDGTWVSTDSEEIARVARELGAAVIDRPPELAGDDVTMFEVALHALDHLPSCEVLVVLQPTSPCRRAEHVDEAVTMLLDSEADGVVSVVEVPHRFGPDSLMRIVDGRLSALEPGAPTLRQDKPHFYARNGPAVLAVRTRGLAARGGLYAGDLRPYVMDPLDSVDVDDASDLALAELLLSR